MTNSINSLCFSGLSSRCPQVGNTRQSPRCLPVPSQVPALGGFSSQPWTRSCAACPRRELSPFLPSRYTADTVLGAAQAPKSAPHSGGLAIDTEGTRRNDHPHGNFGSGGTNTQSPQQAWLHSSAANHPCLLSAQACLLPSTQADLLLIRVGVFLE